jgi:hypothetical protein
MKRRSFEPAEGSWSPVMNWQWLHFIGVPGCATGSVWDKGPKGTVQACTIWKDQRYCVGFYIRISQYTDETWTTWYQNEVLPLGNSRMTLDNLSAIQSHNFAVTNFSLEECFSVPIRKSPHFLKLMAWNACPSPFHITFFRHLYSGNADHIVLLGLLPFF